MTWDKISGGQISTEGSIFNMKGGHYIMTRAKKNFSTLKNDYKLLKNDPRWYLNRWWVTGGHFSTLKNDQTGHFSMGSIFNVTPAQVHKKPEKYKHISPSLLPAGLHYVENAIPVQGNVPCVPQQGSVDRETRRRQPLDHIPSTL